MQMTIDANLYRLYESAVGELLQYAQHVAEHLTYLILVYLALCLLIYKTKRSHEGLGAGCERVLLVTAHPDDECMFFGPTLVALARSGVHIHLLCLSTGKEGHIRRLELYDACAALGIESKNIVVCIDASMPDDPNVHWPSDHVADIILRRTESLSIDAVITFDSGGVSGHRNHSSVFYAVARLSIEKRFPKECQIYTLDSINLIRKYWGYLDLPLSYLLSSHRFILSREDGRVVANAMSKHKSQMVWFRRLYLTFSRYVTINTLRNVKSMDLELELLDE